MHQSSGAYEKSNRQLKCVILFICHREIWIMSCSANPIKNQSKKLNSRTCFYFSLLIRHPAYSLPRKTNELVPNGWGGFFRRPTLSCSRLFESINTLGKHVLISCFTSWMTAQNERAGGKLKSQNSKTAFPAGAKNKKKAKKERLRRDLNSQVPRASQTP